MALTQSQFREPTLGIDLQVQELTFVQLFIATMFLGQKTGNTCVTEDN